MLILIDKCCVSIVLTVVVMTVGAAVRECQDILKLLLWKEKKALNLSEIGFLSKTWNWECFVVDGFDAACWIYNVWYVHAMISTRWRQTRSCCGFISVQKYSLMVSVSRETHHLSICEMICDIWWMISCCWSVFMNGVYQLCTYGFMSLIGGCIATEVCHRSMRCAFSPLRALIGSFGKWDCLCKALCICFHCMRWLYRRFDK